MLFIANKTTSEKSVGQCCVSALQQTADQFLAQYRTSQTHKASTNAPPPTVLPDVSHLSILSAQCSAVSLQPTRLTTASWASWWSSTSTPATSSTSTTSRGRTSRWFTARWTTSGRYVCSELKKKYQKNHLQRNNFKCQTSNGNLLVARCRSSDPAYRPLGTLFFSFFFNIFKRTLTL